MASVPVSAAAGDTGSARINCPVADRSPGSLLSDRATSSRSGPVRTPRLGSPTKMRPTVAVGKPATNGEAPVTPYATTAPRANTSAGPSKRSS